MTTACSQSARWSAIAVLVLGLAVGCGDAASNTEDVARSDYARDIVHFEAGAGAGHGQDHMPDIVLGPPDGATTKSSATDVLSLGSGGTITLTFGSRAITDGPGPDFIVFENAFHTEHVEDGVWEELGAVAVSENGREWKTFSCDPSPNQSGTWPGCAGWTPTRRYDPASVDRLDPKVTGGDAFDLSEVGLERAKYVRITDLSEEPNDSRMAGFDLDAVGMIHHSKGGP